MSKYNKLTKDHVTENVSNRIRLLIEAPAFYLNPNNSAIASKVTTLSDRNVSNLR